MISKCKKLVTNINRKTDLERDLPEYAGLLTERYNYYATVKMCMNYYTIREMIGEEPDDSPLNKNLADITGLIQDHIIERNPVTEHSLNKISELRNEIEYRMKNLTAFTDGFEIYEYILNRIEGRIKGKMQPVDIDQLSARMFRYVFSEKDTVVINSKLQLLMGQLPVRMTKNKFYDIITNTLSIYKGGEISSAEDFADMLRSAALISKPQGFESLYPELFNLYITLEQKDYKNINGPEYDSMVRKIEEAASFISREVSSYMLMQEVVNDVYTIILSIDDSFENNMLNKGYKAAVSILKACLYCDSIDEISDATMDLFVELEGVQEEVYESIVILETAFDDIRKGDALILDELKLTENFDRLDTIEKLMSTSLFVDLKGKTTSKEAVADSDYIMNLRDTITDEFANLFKNKDRQVIRSIMCKILASMSIFLNSQQEIKDYFDYVLENCKDESELMACNKLICEIINQDE